MTKRITTKSQVNAPIEEQALVLPEETSSDLRVAEEEKQEEVKDFEVTHDEEAGTVSFNLVDGTPVVMRSPKPKDFLLINSFMKQAAPEYLTEEMLGFKLITLCMTKYGSKTKVDFYEFLDEVEDIEDFQRVGAAFNFFRSQLERLQAKLKK